MDKMDTVNEIAKESDLIILNTLTIILHNIHGFTLRRYKFLGKSKGTENIFEKNV
jgi:hypothetical protein